MSPPARHESDDGHRMTEGRRLGVVSMPVRSRIGYGVSSLTICAAGLMSDIRVTLAPA
jgi:hypothetical protein